MVARNTDHVHTCADLYAEVKDMVSLAEAAYQGEDIEIELGDVLAVLVAMEKLLGALMYGLTARHYD